MLDKNIAKILLLLKVHFTVKINVLFSGLEEKRENLNCK